ncbi:C-C motif chemokine 3-like 1 [Thunnus albacares]|uniref:C-C motif chemokine 3-like 1 n=1 Tax=Thunnus albacares TaxID=8236 RepID=UPI001CF6F42F|nr:C-C motif chemokine 3-like 1 [Thunnus albacares]
MRILTITLLLLSVCLCTLATSSRRHAAKLYAPCCTRVTSANISSDIIGDSYEKQTAEGLCVEAIILRTSNRKVCANPKAEWVKTLIAGMTSGNQ